MKILINCTGKFCYRYGNFQNTEAVTGGALKNFTKVSPMPESLFYQVAGFNPATLLKKRLSDKCVFL